MVSGEKVPPGGSRGGDSKSSLDVFRTQEYTSMMLDAAMMVEPFIATARISY